MAAPGRSINAIVGFLFTVPVFFTLYGLTSVGLGKVRPDYYSGGQTLPISVVVLGGLIGLWILASLGKGRVALQSGRNGVVITHIVGLFLFFNVLAYLVGSLLSEEIAGVLFLVQVILPVCATLVPLVTIKSFQDLEQWLRWALVGAVAGALILLVINYLNYGPSLFGRSWLGYWERFGIYQADSYVPNILATLVPFGLAFALTSRVHLNRVAAAVSLTFVAVVVVHMDSLTAVLIMAVAVLVMGFMGKRLRFWRPRVGHFLLAGLVLVGPILFLRSAPLALEADYKLTAGETQEAGKGGVNLRLAKYGEVAETLLRSPVWGKGYEVDYSGGLGGLIDRRVGKAHNQLLDIADKAGLPALLLFLALLCVPIVWCFRACKMARTERERVVGVALLAVLVASATVHNLTVVPYVQPYSGIVLYALAGVGVRYATLVSSQRSDITDQPMPTRARRLSGRPAKRVPVSVPSLSVNGG